VGKELLILFPVQTQHEIFLLPAMVAADSDAGTGNRDLSSFYRKPAL
jgi:hypothetical protein